MVFIRIMTCYAQHRNKGIHHYNKVSIIHCSCYHGYRKKEQPNSSVLRDSRLSRFCRGLQLYPHRRTGLTTIPRARGKGCLMSPNISLIRPECHMKGSAGFSVNVPDIPDKRHPLSSFTDKQVATNYMTCRPHPWHVVCIGGYSDLRIPIHGPYCSTSCHLRSHNHDNLPLAWARYPSYHQDYHIRDIFLS